MRVGMELLMEFSLGNGRTLSVKRGGSPFHNVFFVVFGVEVG